MAVVNAALETDWFWRLPLLDKHSALVRGGIEAANTVVSDYATEGFPRFDNDEIES